MPGGGWQFRGGHLVLLHRLASIFYNRKNTISPPGFANEMHSCLRWCSSSYFHSEKYLSSQAELEPTTFWSLVRRLWVRSSKNISKNIIINNIYVWASIHLLTLITKCTLLASWSCDQLLSTPPWCFSLKLKPKVFPHRNCGLTVMFLKKIGFSSLPRGSSIQLHKTDQT